MLGEGHDGAKATTFSGFEDEVGGDYASALARIDIILAELGEEHAQLAADLQATAALLIRRMAAQQAEGERTEAQTYAVHTSSEAETSLTFALNAAYPNPFNPQTTLVFSVADAARVTIVVYDVLGRKISTLVDERLDTGRYETVFDGSSLASGMYLVRMTARPENGTEAHAFTQRVTLLNKMMPFSPPFRGVPSLRGGGVAAANLCRSQPIRHPPPLLPRGTPFQGGTCFCQFVQPCACC